MLNPRRQPGVFRRVIATAAVVASRRPEAAGSSSGRPGPIRPADLNKEDER